MAFNAKDIVLVNRIAFPTGPGAGKNGMTPGQYVTRYMVRDGAVEYIPITGVRRPDAFITRYMARETAVEHSPDIDVALRETDAKHPSHDYFVYNGVGFGMWIDPSTGGKQTSVSMSDDQIRLTAKEIQARFDAGHALSELVVSFTGDYAERMGFIEPGLDLPRHRDGTIDDVALAELQKRAEARNEPFGPYRGHIDQAKLRTAIIHGLDRTGLAQAGLLYAGAVHVNTGNVHVHLVLSTEGTPSRGSATEGLITAKQRLMLRRGIDATLDDSRSLQVTAAAVQHQRTNLVSIVADWAAGLTTDSSAVQNLILRLPKDQTMWRAGSHAAAMAEPNRIARAMTETVIAQHPQEYEMWRQSTIDYIEGRREREGQVDGPKLMARGRRRMVDQCVNAIYARVRDMKKEQELTPMMEVMRIDRGRIRRELAARRTQEANERDRLLTFALRARNYSQRLAEHAALQREYERRAYVFEQNILMSEEAVDERAMAVARFYRNEADYQARCVSKYRYFVGLASKPDPWRERWNREVRPVRAEAVMAHTMLIDPAFDEFGPDQAREADLYAWSHYRVDQGHLMLTQAGRRYLTDHTVALYDLRADHAEARLVSEAAVEGIVFDQNGEPREGTLYDFDDVRGVDLQDLTGDSVFDQPVGSQAFEQFRAATAGRVRGLQALTDYAKTIRAAWRSGRLQGSPITPKSAALNEPALRDIIAMQRQWGDISAQQPDENGNRILKAAPGSDTAAREQAEELVERVTGQAQNDPPDVQTVILDTMIRDSMGTGTTTTSRTRGARRTPDNGLRDLD